MCWTNNPMLAGTQAQPSITGACGWQYVPRGQIPDCSMSGLGPVPSEPPRDQVQLLQIGHVAMRLRQQPTESRALRPLLKRHSQYGVEGESPQLEGLGSGALVKGQPLRSEEEAASESLTHVGLVVW